MAFGCLLFRRKEIATEVALKLVVSEKGLVQKILGETGWTVIALVG